MGDNGYGPNAQDLSNPHGKILRINKDGSIPADNPFAGEPGKLGAIWAYGFRNPWRFQFDSATGKLYGGDVGNFTWEEVNRIVKGCNYGWPVYEGVCQSNCGGYTDPIHAYPQAGESAAVTGGPVYRSDIFPPEYRGDLFFGDYAKGFIKNADLDSNGDITAGQRGRPQGRPRRLAVLHRRLVELVDVHHSTYYRLKRQVDRWRPEALNVRERRRPRMPNQIGPHLEGKVIAFCLAYPGYGPRRIRAEPARAKWGAVRISEHGVWRVLRRFNLNTRASAWRWSPATRIPTRNAPRIRPASATSKRLSPARKWASTASTWGGSPAPGERCALRHQGNGVAIHRDRRRLGFCVGGASRLGAQPSLPALPAARAPRRRGASGRGMAIGGGDLRQRL